jgi:hypothetical protein
MFSNAGNTPDEMERRFIEFGPMIYFNYAQELRKNQPKSLLCLILEHLKRNGKRPTTRGLQSSSRLSPHGVIASGLQEVVSSPGDLPHDITATTFFLRIGVCLAIEQSSINQKVNICTMPAGIGDPACPIRE